MKGFITTGGVMVTVWVALIAITQPGNLDIVRAAAPQSTASVFFEGKGAGVRDINIHCSTDIIHVFRLWPGDKRASVKRHGVLTVPLGNGLNREVRRAYAVPGHRYWEFTMIGKRRINTRNWANIFVHDAQFTGPAKPRLTLVASFCGDQDDEDG